MTDTEVINKKRTHWNVTDQKVIKAWLEEHAIDATLVPANASFTFADGICTTQQYLHNDAGKLVLVAGSVPQDTITFPVAWSPFPFPLVTPPSEGTKP